MPGENYVVPNVTTATEYVTILIQELTDTNSFIRNTQKSWQLSQQYKCSYKRTI